MNRRGPVALGFSLGNGTERHQMSTSPLTHLVAGKLCAADEKLGDQARRRIKAWRDKAADLREEHGALTLKRDKVRDERQRIETNLDDLLKGKGGTRPVNPADPAIKAMQRDLGDMKAEIARLQEVGAQKGRHSAALRQLVEKCEQGIRDADVIWFHGSKVDGSPHKGETAAQAVEREVGALRKLKADLHTVESVGMTAAAAIAEAHRQVDAIAEVGRPDIGRLVGFGGDVKWTRWQRIPAMTAKEIIAVESDDCFPALAWLFPNELKARIAAQIKTEVGDGGLSPEEKDERSSAIKRDILETQRRSWRATPTWCRRSRPTTTAPRLAWRATWRRSVNGRLYDDATQPQAISSGRTAAGNRGRTPASSSSGHGRP